MTNSVQNPLEESLIAPAFEELTAYGYYVLIDQVYYLITPYDIQVEFGFNKLGKLTYAPVEDQFTIVVYKPEWDYDQTVFFAQDLDIVNHNYTKKIEPMIEKFGQHIHKLTFPALHKGQLLVIRDINNLYGIGMGSISDTLVELFNTTNAPAAAVLSNINQALKSFPQNLQLQASKGVWELKEIDDKSQKAWEGVQKKLAQYNEREDRAGKLVFADDVVHEINYYLSIGDSPAHKEEAEEILKEIDAFKNQKEEATAVPLPDKSLLSSQVTVYVSRTFTVTYVEIGDEVLLRFTGIPNEFDNKVLRHKKQIQNEFSGAFILSTTEITGKNWNTFSYENNGWGGHRTFVYPPNINQQTDVYLDIDYIPESAEDMYNDYCSQLEQK